MVRDLYFKKSYVTLVLFIINILATNAQNLIGKESGFAFGGETLVLSPYEGSINSIYETDYEVTDDSFIWGGSLYVNYHFSPNVYTNLALGIEKLNQPEIIYYPLTIGGGLITSSSKSGFLLQADLGTHLGDLDSNGFIFRGKFGYNISFLNPMSFNFGLLYSFQNLDKTFENSLRPENYYNLESIGIFINIKWKNYEK